MGSSEGNLSGLSPVYFGFGVFFLKFPVSRTVMFKFSVEYLFYGVPIEKVPTLSHLTQTVDLRQAGLGCLFRLAWEDFFLISLGCVRVLHTPYILLFEVWKMFRLCNTYLE